MGSFLEDSTNFSHLSQGTFTAVEHNMEHIPKKYMVVPSKKQFEMGTVYLATGECSMLKVTVTLFRKGCRIRAVQVMLLVDQKTRKDLDSAPDVAAIHEILDRPTTKWATHARCLHHPLQALGCELPMGCDIESRHSVGFGNWCTPIPLQNLGTQK